MSDTPPYAIGICKHCRSEMVVRYPTDEPDALMLIPRSRQCPGRPPNLHQFDQETIRHPIRDCVVIWGEQVE